MSEQNIPRREREKLQQRQEILSAALELFSNRGFSNVSMLQIAERSEFAVGTLYKFFANKEELYKNLLLEHSHKFCNGLLEAISKPNNEIEKLQSFVATKGELFKANVSMIRLYLAEAQGPTVNPMAGLNATIKQQHFTIIEALSSIFESGMKRKSFKRISHPRYLAIALDSFTTTLFFLWLEDPEHNPYPEDLNVILDVLFKGVID